MFEQSLKEFLLALHYVMPASINRLWPLLSCESLEKISSMQLSKLLKITPQKALKLQHFLNAHRHFSFSSYYEQQKIIPITFFDAA